MTSGRESPTSSPAPGLLDERDYEDDELELGGEAVPGPSASYAYPPDRYALRSRADEDPNPVSGSGLESNPPPAVLSLAYGRHQAASGGEAAAPSHSGLEEYEGVGSYAHRHNYSAPCAPSSSGSYAMASSLQESSARPEMLGPSHHWLGVGGGRADLPISSTWLGRGQSVSSWDSSHLVDGAAVGSNWRPLEQRDWGSPRPGSSGQEAIGPEEVSLDEHGDDNEESGGGPDEDHEAVYVAASYHEPDLHWNSASSSRSNVAAGQLHNRDAAVAVSRYGPPPSLQPTRTLAAPRPPDQRTTAGGTRPLIAENGAAAIPPTVTPSNGNSPQPSSSAASLLMSRLSPVDPVLSGPILSSSSGCSSLAEPQPSHPVSGSSSYHLLGSSINQQQQQLPNSNRARCSAQSAKRSISFPDSPTGPTSEQQPAEKRPRLRLSCDSDTDMRPDSPGGFAAAAEPRPALLQRGGGASAQQLRGGVLASSASGLLQHNSYSSSWQSPASSSGNSGFVPPENLFSAGSSGVVIGAAAASSSNGRPSAAADEGSGSSGGGIAAPASPAASSSCQAGSHDASMPGTSSSSSSSLLSSSAAAISGSSYLLPLSIDVAEDGGHQEAAAGPSHPQQHDSPSGSEVSEAGPSSGQHERRGTAPATAGHRRSSCSPGSPTGSEVSTAGPSHYSRGEGQSSNPNSPSESDADMDEAGPSVRGAQGGRHWELDESPGYQLELGREAAPAHRSLSPQPFRYRARRQYSEQCAISSSTGPVDSNPPTPEYEYHVDDEGHIDNDLSYPSPPRYGQARSYNNDMGENVVDSTVDSTSGYFMVPSPPPSAYNGNEAAHEGDSSEGDEEEEEEEGADTESIPGSEASSTTASLHNEQNFYHNHNHLDLEEDPEGISTSGQPDEAIYRPILNGDNNGFDNEHDGDDDNNDVEDREDEAIEAQQQGREAGPRYGGYSLSHRCPSDMPGPSGSRFLDHSLVSLSENRREVAGDDIVQPTAEPPAMLPNGFKKPFNKKGRILETLHCPPEVAFSDPQPGPSSCPAGSERNHLAVGAVASQSDVAGLPMAEPLRQASSVFELKLPGSGGSNSSSAVGIPVRTDSSASSMPGMSATLSVLTSSSGNNSSPHIAQHRSRSFFSTSATSALSSNPNVSLFPVDKNSANFRLHPQTSEQLHCSGAAAGASVPRSAVLIAPDKSYSASLGIGLAFSRLPGSSGSIGGQPSATATLSGPLSKRLRTRHYQDTVGQPESSGGVPAGEETPTKPAVSLSLMPAAITVAVPPAPRLLAKDEKAAVAGNVGDTADIFLPLLVGNKEEEEDEEGENCSPGELDVGEEREDEDGGEEERPDQYSFLGGSQQTFRVNIETGAVAGFLTAQKKSDSALLLAEEKVNTRLKTFDRAEPTTEIFSGKGARLSTATATAVDCLKRKRWTDEPGSVCWGDSPPKSEPGKSAGTIESSARPSLPRELDNRGPSAAEDSVICAAGRSVVFSRIASQAAVTAPKSRLLSASQELCATSRSGGVILAPGSQDNVLVGNLRQPRPCEIEAKVDARTISAHQVPVVVPEPVTGGIISSAGDPSPIEHQAAVLVSAPPSLPPLAAATLGGSPPSRYVCHICDRKFERQPSLARHLVLHRGTKQFGCEDCGQKFSHTFNLERHRKRAHQQSQQQQQEPGESQQQQHERCTSCGLWFPSSMVLKVHLFSHNPNKEQHNWTVEDAVANKGGSAQDMKFQCPSKGCGWQYDNWLELVEHSGDHGTPFHPSDTMSGSGGPQHKCELCYKIFATDARLQKHMAVHGKEELKPLACTQCPKRFLTRSALAGHIKSHGQPDHLYDCPICLEEFEQMSSLKEHVYTHRKNFTFTCPHCSKVFEEYPAIRKHIRAFHSHKRFSCQLCGKTFGSKVKVKMHMVRHSESREFSCTECGKEFKRKDKLRDHLKKSHSGARREETTAPTAAAPVSDTSTDSWPSGSETPPPPPKPVKFIPKVSPTDLERFVYKCSNCMLGFKRRGMLVNHLAKRHPDVAPTSVPELNLPILKATKDFFCQYCDKVYKSSTKRKVHIQKCHPGQALPAGAREVSEETFSQTVGSVALQPHSCQACHKQYASKAKLLQHIRINHKDSSSTSASTSCRHDRPKQMVYVDPPSPLVPSYSAMLTLHPPGHSNLESDDTNSNDLENRLLVDQSESLHYETDQYFIQSAQPEETSGGQGQSGLSSGEVGQEGGQQLLFLPQHREPVPGGSRSAEGAFGRSAEASTATSYILVQTDGASSRQPRQQQPQQNQQHHFLTVDPRHLDLNTSESSTIIIEAPAGLQPAQLQHIIQTAAGTFHTICNPPPGSK